MKKKTINYFESVSRWLTVAMSLLFMGILLFKNLIPVLISNEYLGSVRIMPFLLFYPIMYTLGITTELGLQFKRKTNLSLIISVIVLLMNVVLNLIFIPKLGAKGAALATGISYISFFWIKTLISRRLWEQFELNYYIKTTIILFICALLNTFVYAETLVFCINVFAVILLFLIFRDDIKKLLYIMRSKGGRKWRN